MSGTDYTLTAKLGLYKPVYNMDAEQWAGHMNANADALDAVLGSAAPGPFVPLAGGIGMTGLLTLSGPPTQPLHAATMAYADTKLARAGTTTSDNAAAGMIGEYISSEIVSAFKVSLTTATAAAITSISLTAGDWDITGLACFVTAAATSVTSINVAPNTSVVIPSPPNQGGFAFFTQPPTVPGAGTVYGMAIAKRYSLAATTTIYLVARAAFTLDTMQAYGFIGARRAR